MDATEEIDAKSCGLLWLKVLLHGLIDAQRGDTTWLTSTDFIEVCFLAGVDPDLVLERFNQPGCVITRPPMQVLTCQRH